jgi:two-component system response regulator HydG
MSTLLVTSGHHVGRRFALGELTRIGRAPDNEIVLPENAVSRYHAEIERRHGNYFVSDLDSKNGVFVNEVRRDNFRLHRGDRVTVGDTTLVFEAPQELKTARFTNTLIHLDPELEETMRAMDRRPAAETAMEETTALVLKLAEIFDAADADLPSMLDHILRRLLDMIGATVGSILLRGRDNEIVPLAAVCKGDELHLNLESVRLTLAEGKSILTASLAGPGGGAPTRRPRKAMIVPMFEREKVFGALHVERPEGSDFALRDITLLQGLARLVAGSMRQAIKLEQLAQARSGDDETLLGVSPAMAAVRDQIARAAPTDTTVLLTGETGTGKELTAHSVHMQSARAAGPFVPINCAAIPDTLIESELFGYEKGAFTGADAMKRGKVEMADRGTLFLDEIGEMSPDVQPKLLRFLEERIFYRVGGIRPIQVDVRIIAATNRDLTEAVKSGRFRDDLLYRLNVLQIQLPPLRDRREDIRPLIDHFAPKLSASTGRSFLGIDDRAWLALERYAWPGNVRELMQSIERALILADDGLLRAEHFQIHAPLEVEDSTGTHPDYAEDTPTGRPSRSPAPPTLAEVERQAIVRALRFCKGNKIRAAEVLQIHRNTLRKKIKEFDLKDS